MNISLKNIRIGMRPAAGFSVVVGMFIVTLLLVGLSLDGVTKDVNQIKAKSTQVLDTASDVSPALAEQSKAMPATRSL